MNGIVHHLHDSHSDLIDGFVRHPFFLMAEDGTLPSAARDRYFLNERYFVGAARGVFAHLLIGAPSLTSARHLIAILNGLVNEQEPLFEKIYARLSLVDPLRPTPGAKILSIGMTDIARDGSYVVGLAAMLAAEWTYREVARRGNWAMVRDDTLRDWFLLHAELRFSAGVEWLEREIDDSCRDTDEVAVNSAFRRAVKLEIEFHDDALRA